MRDRHHDISSKRVQERVREKSYTWHFETSMQVDKRVKSELLSHLPGGQLPLEMPDPGDATPAANRPPRRRIAVNPDTRKKVLLTAATLIMVLICGDWLWRNAVSGPIDSRQRKLESYRKTFERKEEELDRALAAGEELTRWEAQSLPSDPEVARSLYQAWLLELVGYVDLANPNVDSGPPLSQKGVYRTLSFTVRGRGTLTN